MLVLTVALLVGCPDSSSNAGSARFAVSVPQALSSNISRVSVTSSATDTSSVTVDLAPTHGVWSGIIGNIPAGPNRSFLARAFDSSGNLLFEGSASGITVSENQEVVARDPEGSALSFTWNTGTGSLGSPDTSASRSRVTWAAPSCVSASTTPSITVTVTNTFNLTATRSFSVTGLPACTTSGGWASTGSMAQPHYAHSATLLPDGKVLVTGGINSGTPLPAAELFGPVSGGADTSLG